MLLVVGSPVNQPTGSSAAGKSPLLAEFVKGPAGGLCRAVAFRGDVAGRDHRSLDRVEDGKDAGGRDCWDELAAVSAFPVYIRVSQPNRDIPIGVQL